MKKYWFGFLFAMVSCVQAPYEEPQLLLEDDFAINVPQDFTWSCIQGKSLVVNFTKDRVKTNMLDNTIVELLDEDDVLLDALTILDATAEFNVRIPLATSQLKLRAHATGEEMTFDIGESIVSFSVHADAISAIDWTDSDGDGSPDLFDMDPENANVSVKVNNKVNNDLKSASARTISAASYVIFEDLWPAKGDYDFNDLVVKTVFAWDRNQANYITEITVSCNIEYIGAGLELGLGFELFENKGADLYYLENIIAEMEGAAIDQTVQNGVIAVSNVKTMASKQFEFVITLNENEIKEFVMIPYLFRTNDPGHQVRPYGAPPTQGQDMKMFRTHDDKSPNQWNWNAGTKFKYPLSSSEAFYRSTENYPWGIEFITTKSFNPCKEKNSIVKEYPTFKEWAETGGNNYSDWYNNPL